MKKMILMVAALFSFAVASAQSDVVSTYNSGIEAMKAGEFDKAAELMEQVIIDGEMEEDEAILGCVQNAQKAVADAYFRGGLACAKAKQFDQAIAKFETAIEKSKLYNNTRVAQNAGKALAQVYQIQGGEPFNAGDYAKAVEVFTKGYEANPRNTEMAMLLAESYFRMNDYENGMKICDQVMALPNTTLFEAGKAEAQSKMNMYTNNKVAELQKAGDFDGVIALAGTIADQALAQRITVQAYSMKKDYAKVIELAEAAAALQTNDEDKSDIYYILGAAHNAKDQKPQAIAAFNKVTAGDKVAVAKQAVADLSK
ncbi:MAG: tetratricopeptide repeat protein [Alistipes sp.]|nr:tetratricopeptide repeat protein [Alistipes sp.]